MQNFIVCSFYTPDYEIDIKCLKASLEKFGLEYLFKPIPSRGTWEANTCAKPEIILECLEAHPGKDIIYLDADAELVREPTELLNIGTDIAFCFRVRHKSRRKRRLVIPAGTIVLKNNDRVKGFLGEWIKAARSGDRFMHDQDALDMAISDSPGLTITVLTSNVVVVCSNQTISDDDIVRHYSASRRSKISLRRHSRHKRNRIAAAVGVAAITLIALAVTL